MKMSKATLNFHQQMENMSKVFSSTLKAQTDKVIGAAIIRLVFNGTALTPSDTAE